MPCKIVVGGFFGDEGKGKIISYLAWKEQPVIVARGGVGPNAGHTVYYQDQKYKLRMLPSGFVADKARLLIGAGVLIDPRILLNEIKITKTSDRFGLDPKCIIISDEHINQDKSSTHLREKIGTTGTGCGPANVDRVKRVAKQAKDEPSVQEFLTDVSFEVNNALEKNKPVLIEGTQGTFISLFYGDYPFVTSKDTTAGQVCADIGIGPTKVSDVVLVFKSYVTRVGEGPLQDELEVQEAKRRGWHEIATVTGRIRRAAPFDFHLAKKAVRLNGATQLAITKLDILFPKTSGLTNEKNLPKEALGFINKIEDNLGVPVTLLGTGPGVNDIITRKPF